MDLYLKYQVDIGFEMCCLNFFGEKHVKKGQMI